MKKMVRGMLIALFLTYITKFRRRHPEKESAIIFFFFFLPFTHWPNAALAC